MTIICRCHKDIKKGFEGGNFLLLSQVIATKVLAVAISAAVTSRSNKKFWRWQFLLLPQVVAIKVWAVTISAAATSRSNKSFGSDNFLSLPQVPAIKVLAVAFCYCNKHSNRMTHDACSLWWCTGDPVHQRYFSASPCAPQGLTAIRWWHSHASTVFKYNRHMGMRKVVRSSVTLRTHQHS